MSKHSDFVSQFAAEAHLVAQELTQYDHSKGDRLYHNAHLDLPPMPDGSAAHLPRDGEGHLKLPANAAVAIVNFHCKYCHTFMVKADYPTHLPEPDGRPIVYIDMHDEQAREFIKEQGYKGAGKDMWSVILNPHPTLHGKKINLAEGGHIPSKSFPIFLHTDETGRLAGGLSAGIKGTLNRFAHIRGEEIASVAAPTQTPAPAYANTDMTTEEARACITLLGDEVQFEGSRLLATQDPSEAKNQVIYGALKALGIHGLRRNVEHGRYATVIPEREIAHVAEMLGQETPAPAPQLLGA